MFKFNIVRTETGQIRYIETPLSGHDLLGCPELNKGCAFTLEEREQFQLHGLLPFRVETLSEQVGRMYAQYHGLQSALRKNIYLNALHDYNQTLFYQLVTQHLDEMLPILYTPTVGEAVQRFSVEHRQTRGLYVSFPDRNHLKKILANRLPKEVNLAIVTDGERVLGIGDQGIGGMAICNAKLMVYTLCGHINPHHALPIQLDVGTNNEKLLSDPMYLGWRHERIQGQAYDDFVDEFVTMLTQAFPEVFLHWEDIGRDNARRLLNRYQNQFCTFNDDMQGTATVIVAGILAGVRTNQSTLAEQRIVLFGAGTAGVGIVDELCMAMQHEGLSREEAQKRFWLVDRRGLIFDGQAYLPFQTPYTRHINDVAEWNIRSKETVTLLDVVKHVKPTILIGCSTVGGAFTEEMVKTMSEMTEHPIILPLSNPTELSEATPFDLMQWTQGKALIATGSPYPEVMVNGKPVRIAQGNNAFAFPGIGLGVMAVKAKRLTDEMLWAAVQALSECAPILKNKDHPLLPPLSEIQSISRQVARAVALTAQHQGLTSLESLDDLDRAINQTCWEPVYYPYKKTPE